MNVCEGEKNRIHSSTQPDTPASSTRASARTKPNSPASTRPPAPYRTARVSKRRRPELRNHVAHLTGRRRHRQPRTHIDDVPPALLHHMRKRVETSDVCGANVNPHHQIKAFRRSLQDRSCPDCSRVVHEYVESTEFPHRAIHRRSNRGLIPHIRRDGE